MKTKITLISIAICLFCACKKDNAIHTWEGNVLEYGTMKPVPNATLYLQTISGSILGPGISKTIDSTISDLNGYFKFTFLDEPYSFRIKGSAEQYFQNDVSRIQNNKNTNKNLILDPYAWMKISVQSNNPANTINAIYFDYSCDNKGWSGVQIDTFSICRFNGNRPLDFKYTISTNAYQKTENKMVNLGSKDTAEIYITF